ncbi:MAG: hypothetical protein JWR50_1691 [Mucilaginibacter sp.]|nr:hypothetical protein [Mucilaginibacter sp.]
MTRLFHESVKQMKQVKQNFELNLYPSVFYKKPLKQNVTTFKSVKVRFKFR